jgi:alcohol dehydrogenase
MDPTTFQALVVDQCPDGTFRRSVAQRQLSDLPDAELLIQVQYSSLNYKDALSASGHKGVTRCYPHTPGIDAAGIVRRSRNDAYPVGSQVIVTGHDLGTNTSGGLAQYIAVPGDWAVMAPAGLTLRQSMALGTAGFTAAMALSHLEDHGLTPGEGEVLITGATGGVGSLTIALMNRLGYRVVAITGKADFADYLGRIGAADVLDRHEFLAGPDKPLWPGRWAGVVDTVGGPVLAAAIKSVAYGGAVACCGLAASAQLHTTVYPLILRNVRILGVETAQCPLDLRKRLWAKLVDIWMVPHLDAIVREVTLQEVDPVIESLLSGLNHGRVVVRIP